MLDHDDSGVRLPPRLVADSFDVFVYVVVLNLFVEYFPNVLSETFTLSLLTAVLLKAVLEVVLVIKKRVRTRFQQSATRTGKVLAGLMLWLLLVASKFVVLALVDIVFGSRVSLGGFIPVTLLIIVLMLSRVMVRWLLNGARMRRPTGGTADLTSLSSRSSDDTVLVRSFDYLVAEAATVDVTGWDFSWLDGRATEERPPWGYARLLASRLAAANTALDIDTGGGEIIAAAPVLPARMYVTESWPPNARRAQTLLEPRGVEVVETVDGAGLPFGPGTFDLVASRHPVRPQWAEINRVLVTGGRYFAQHVGPASAFELIQCFLGPLPEERRRRDSQAEADDAERSGLTVMDLRTARCRMEFFDIGAVVYILRKCVWWVPDFSVQRYRDRLEYLDELIRRDGSFVAHSTRHLIEARR